ncbi:hypothetical protein B0I35DRAFT_479324 [Stachybotrys elegans]|uniref:Uncharacterized protein n=1 Tax=Stachybotrys elegans TaxID=80388 RepID=A0A8K0WPH8_9HYPO|nr:hypothetical protein B0I35DRAFT_479324 [Stachybotrys elegans]
MGRQEEDEVRSWGFSNVFEWTDPPNSHYPPHSHAGVTTHLILKGDLTICYPNESNREKKHYGVGSRIDVKAGQVHEVWIGEGGCTMIIGD